MSESYSKKYLRDLKVIARERGIKYLTYIKKERLIEMLEKNDADPSLVLDEDAKAACFAAYDKWRKNPDNKEKYLTYHKSYNRRVRAEAKCV